MIQSPLNSDSKQGPILQYLRLLRRPLYPNHKKRHILHLNPTSHTGLELYNSCYSLRTPYSCDAIEHEQRHLKLLAEAKSSLDPSLLFYSVFKPETQHCPQPAFSPPPYTTSLQSTHAHLHLWLSPTPASSLLPRPEAKQFPDTQGFSQMCGFSSFHWLQAKALCFPAHNSNNNNNKNRKRSFSSFLFILLYFDF